MMIPNLLELVDLPEGNTVRRCLITTLDARVVTLVKCQDDSDLWYTLLDDPHSYPEVSTTISFAYGILKMMRKRYIGQHCTGVAERAIRGIVHNISPQGELLQTSFDAGMGVDLDFYRQILLTSMSYSQVMAVLCLTEYLRKYF